MLNILNVPFLNSLLIPFFDFLTLNAFFTYILLLFLTCVSLIQFLQLADSLPKFGLNLRLASYFVTLFCGFVFINYVDYAEYHASKNLIELSIKNDCVKNKINHNSNNSHDIKNIDIFNNTKECQIQKITNDLKF